MNTFLTIRINITDVIEVSGDSCSSRMILFKGDAASDFFNGTVMPGAVDTQIISNGITKLSARYTLDGFDSSGNRCRIFVENNGTDDNGAIVTTPKIITDSPLLKHFENKTLSGSVASGENGLIVTIFYE